jgi:geranylgeranyl diphosphate synthase, type I
VLTETGIVNLREATAIFMPLIEAEMRRALGNGKSGLDPFFGMMHYHLGWADEHFRPAQTNRGKRLRPLFTLLACQAAAGDPARALPAAAAVELIHNFSLIHDDIQDRSQTRRGRKTIWVLWGDAQGINAGDTMFTLARRSLLRLGELGLSAEATLEAVRKLDDACLELCYGQHLDLSFEKRLDVDLESYLTMIRGKTAALLCCAGYLGALVATSDVQIANNYGRLGQEMGLAFQIQDDILGIWGQEATTGKPAADDLRRRKKSLPIVYVLGRGQDDPDAARLREIYQKPKLTEQDLAAALHVLDRTGSREQTIALAQGHVEAATQLLDEVTSSNPAGAALREMATFFVRRDY